MGQYFVGLACLNGHAVNSAADRSPELNAKHCSACGEPTIRACSNCSAAIRGYYFVADVIGWSEWDVPSHCHECGAPYPWTQRRSEALAAAIDELDELPSDERDRLKKSIPDILAETPKSETAVLRFKKAIAHVGTASGKVLSGVIQRVAADAVKGMLGF